MKPKTGHVWRYIGNSWIEVPEAEAPPQEPFIRYFEDKYQPPFKGMIQGFTKITIGEDVTSHDVVKEYLDRTIAMVHDIDSTEYSAIRYYEDLLMWRAFVDPITGEIDASVFDGCDMEETDRLEVSFSYISELSDENRAYTAMVAIQEMNF